MGSAGHETHGNQCAGLKFQGSTTQTSLLLFVALTSPLKVQEKVKDAWMLICFCTVSKWGVFFTLLLT